MNRFPIRLGQVVATRGAVDSLGDAFSSIATMFLNRHAHGDWGDLDAEDTASNNAALVGGGMLLSVYHHDNTKYYVITEHDRSVTTLLLPSEY